MSEDLMDYQSLVESAMRGVVRDALKRVVADGLPGDHHLYVTFRTQAPGVHIANRLVAQYPDEMTIVLQYQFWGLEVDDESFEITLSFSGKNERLHIPFDAVTGFADPSVNFGLQFKSGLADEDEAEEEAGSGAGAGGTTEEAPLAAEQTDGAAEAETADGDDAPKTGEVVTLDSFRKKKT